MKLIQLAVNAACISWVVCSATLAVPPVIDNHIISATNTDQQAPAASTFAPLFDAEVKIIASDTTSGDFFGSSVSLSGDTAIIGSPPLDGTGAAYIFDGIQCVTNSGGEVAKLLASDAMNTDRFGISVAIDGDTAIVGADLNDDDGDNSGSVYIFQRDVGGTDNWGEVTKLTASDAATADLFGNSVSINGDTAIVGAWFNDDAGSASGSAYIFQRNQGGMNNWGEVTKLTASDAAFNDYFGKSVSISGDIAIVGAWRDDDAGNESGSAYIFHRNQGGTDLWGEVIKLTASDTSLGFGSSVSIDGNTAIVGASFNITEFNPGAAYIFSRNFGGTDNWGEVTKITASDGNIQDFFGISVSISGDIALVGASGDNNNISSSYIFQRNQGGADNWGQTTKLTPTPTTANRAAFGQSVSIDGEVALIGSPEDNAISFQHGAAYLYFSSIVSTCGDGILDQCEACDDGNNIDCDGCSSDCLLIETGCGDGVVCGVEVCDDGNNIECDGCRGDCLALGVPCPACPLDTNSDCQNDFASISDTSDRHHNIRAADDFIPLSGTINRICWSGVWGGTEAGVNCNDNPPDSAWYLTIYEDDGNGLPDINAIVVGPEQLITHDGRTITNLQAGFKPTSYSAPVSITGLTAGNCYWIEILGEGSGNLNSEACSWNWFYTDTSAGQGAESESEDGNGWSVHARTSQPVPYVDSNLVKNDRAFCIDSGMAKNTVGNEGVDGGCGDKTGTFACCYRYNTGAILCTSNVTLYECILNPVDNGLNGIAYTGVSCPDAGGTHICEPPVNDDCVTSATVIAPAACTATTDVGNCAKNKSRWCSPLFLQCAGGNGLCIPILDDNAIESTLQYDCEIQPTDNRFATTDGPPSQNNPNVIDDCSGSDNGGGPFRADVWWKVTAPCNGKMSATMCGGGVYDAMMAAYTACPNGNDPSAPTLIECNDDSCGSFGTVSEIPAFNVEQDQEITIRIGGWVSNSAAIVPNVNDAAQGQSQLHVRFACRPFVILPPVGLTGEHGFSKDRYISMDPSANSATEVAMRVTRIGSAVDKYVDCTSLTNLGPDGWYARLIDGPLPAAGDTTYYCDMSGVTTGLHVRGCSIVPGNMYNISMSDDGSTFTTPLFISTTPPQLAAGRQFGDVVGAFTGGEWTMPDGLVTSGDIVAVVKKFQLDPDAPIVARVDNADAVPNTIVSAGADVLRAVQAFAAEPFGLGVTDCLTGTCVPPQGGLCE